VELQSSSTALIVMKSLPQTSSIHAHSELPSTLVYPHRGQPLLFESLLTPVLFSHKESLRRLPHPKPAVRAVSLPRQRKSPYGVRGLGKTANQQALTSRASAADLVDGLQYQLTKRPMTIKRPRKLSPLTSVFRAFRRGGDGLISQRVRGELADDNLTARPTHSVLEASLARRKADL
jgi:hypothetical protein